MKKLLVIFAIVFLSLQVLEAQTTIKGKVSNKKGGKAIPEVVVDGTNAQGKVLVSTKTDAKGKFQVTLPAGTTSIEVKKPGFQPRTIPVGKKKKMKIKMLQQ